MEVLWTMEINARTSPAVLESVSDVTYGHRCGAVF